MRGDRTIFRRWSVGAIALATALCAGLPKFVVADKPVAGKATAASFDPAKLPAAAAREVDFVHDVRPLLETRCWRCHGEAKHESGLSLHRREAAMAGGDNGPAFQPGHSAQSRLIRFVSGLDPDTVMPPDGEGERLSAKQVGLLRAWIDQGAKWPKEADTLGPSRSQHWSYQKPVRPPLPEVKNAAWPRSELDRFILARLEKEGLAPVARGRSGPADPPRLARSGRPAADAGRGRRIRGRQGSDCL